MIINQWADESLTHAGLGIWRREEVVARAPTDVLTTLHSGTSSAHDAAQLRSEDRDAAVVSVPESPARVRTGSARVIAALTSLPAYRRDPAWCIALADVLVARAGQLQADVAGVGARRARVAVFARVHAFCKTKRSKPSSKCHVSLCSLPPTLSLPN